MLEWIRLKFGPVIISLIIGFIAFVFVFYGVFSPKSTRGMHSGAVAGKVNGDSISVAEFSRAFSRRLEMFKNMGGTNLTDEQIKQFRIRDGVFNELVARKLKGQDAVRRGMIGGSEEVRDNIRKMTVFHKDGRFDFDQYRQVLEANRLTPAGFELMMKEDLMLQHWEDYLRGRVHVSDEEVKQEFLTSKDKRNIKYVLLTNESGRKGVKVPAADVQKFLADQAKSNLAKGRFDAKKDQEYKGKTFDQVKDAIAEDILAAEKSDEIRKINDRLADQVLGLIGADKKADVKVNALLKQYGVEVKATGLLTRPARHLPAIGEAVQLIADAFDKKSPIDVGAAAGGGGKAKKYSVPAGVVVGIVSESEKPDLAKFEEERDKLMKQVASRKENELHQAMMKKLQSKAKIERNEAVVDQKEDFTVTNPYDGG